MEERAAKLALARKKLKDHQEKKTFSVQRDDLLGDASQIAIKQDTILNTVINDEHHDINIHNEHIVDDSNHTCNDGIIKSYDLKGTAENTTPETGINVTEILISNKRNLEFQMNNLQSKLLELECKYNFAINNNTIANQTIQHLENELKNVNTKISNATNELIAKDITIKELAALKSTLSEENSNFQEQLEFTKTILTAKENENNSLHSQLFNLQNHLDATQLQLQQLTSGSFASPTLKSNEIEQNEGLIQKITSLEQQLKLLQKEREQINLHYEHYVSELNEQLRSVVSKNEALTKDNQELSNRENSLIEQISDMEIRLQNYNMQKKAIDENTPSIKSNMEELQHKYETVQENYNSLSIRYNDLQKQFDQSNNQIKELSEMKESEHEHDNLSISKLTADITSDKIAAQRATEQNKKLKQDIQGLEDAFIKMSKDKLELTEKLTAEKYLNRELTIKLAEIDEKAKDMQIKLKAKDDEMIRLQASYRDLEKEHENLEVVRLSDDNNSTNVDECSNLVNNTSGNECVDINSDKKEQIRFTESTHEHQCKSLHETENKENGSNIPKEDAMKKLQERFLKIMGDVADLSDEKHRLEHIILQLQNETETICEYVALYQQQRSLLKRRDEERSAQIKMFELECAKLKAQLEELTAILVRFAEDKELSAHFQMESRHNDIQKIMNLLSNLKTNSLIDTKKKNLDFKNFYPCNCCSGQLIEV